jgi:multiple sugar transport system substrate-binding protein
MTGPADPRPTRRRFRTTGATLAIGSGALAAACGATSEPAPTTSKGPLKSTFYTVFASGEPWDRYQAFWTNFTKEYPNLQVEMRPGTGNYQTHREKILLEHVAGDAADFYDNGWGPWTDMVDKGVIMDLMPYVKRDKIDLNKDFITETVNAYTYDGKFWAMLHAVSGDSLAVNKRLLQNASLPLPPTNPEDRSWTMEKFLEYAQKMTRAPEQFGFGGAINAYNVCGVTDGTYFGQPAWDTKTNKCLMNQSRFKQGLQFFKDLREKYTLIPPTDQINTLRGQSTLDVFYTGKIGMQRPAGTFITNPPKDVDWGLVAVPYSGPGRNMSGRFWAQGFHVDAGSKNKDATWEVFKALMKPDTQVAWVETFATPFTALNAAQPKVLERFKQKTGVDATAWAAQAGFSGQSGSGMLRMGAWPAVQRDLTPIYNDFLAGTMGVNEYADRATELIDRLLGKKA